MKCDNCKKDKTTINYESINYEKKDGSPIKLCKECYDKAEGIGIEYTNI